MTYTLISFDNVHCIAVIQVNGCTKQTQLDVPINITQGSQAWLDLLSAVAQSVLNNMDPNSPTYDASLVS